MEAAGLKKLPLIRNDDVCHFSVSSESAREKLRVVSLSFSSRHEFVLAERLTFLGDTILH